MVQEEEEKEEGPSQSDKKYYYYYLYNELRSLGIHPKLNNDLNNIEDLEYLADAIKTINVL